MPRDRPDFDELTDIQRQTLEKAWNSRERLAARGSAREGEIMAKAFEAMVYDHNPAYVRAFQLATRVPVTMEEFIESEDFLGNITSVWPSIREDVLQVNPDWMMPDEARCAIVLLGGATGIGKSFIAIISLVYRLYWLSCFSQPQALFPSINRFTKIVFMLQGVQEAVTKRVLYEPLRGMFTAMPFTVRYLSYDRHKESTLLLGNNIEVVPTLASVSNVLGQAVACGSLDEANFMARVENSKQVAGARGKGGTYDQAEMVYNSLADRVKSRFLTLGPNPTGLFVSSSVHYMGDFLDRQIQTQRENPDPEVVVFERAQYEAVPATGRTGRTFRFLVGTTDYAPRILQDHEVAGTHYPENADVRDVPEEYRGNFRRDPNGAQRNIIGVASAAINSFIQDTNAIVDSIQRWRDAEHKTWVEEQNIVLVDRFRMPNILEDNLPHDQEPRFCHIDLSKSRDRCGVAIGKCTGVVPCYMDDASERTELLPEILIECAISIQPQGGQEIDLAKVRRWVSLLKAAYGINIVSVTYDGFQSTESVQAWKAEGMRSGVLSMDRTMEAYETTRTALYDDRLDLCDNPLLQTELATLEMNAALGKIDHAPKGSKDVSDAVAGVVSGVSKSRHFLMMKVEFERRRTARAVNRSSDGDTSAQDADAA